MSSIDRRSDAAAVLIFDQNAAGRTRLRELLRQRGFRVLETASTETFADDITRLRPDLAIACPPSGEERKILGVTSRIREITNVPVALFVRGSGEELAIDALRAGIRDYLRQPWSDEDVLECVRRCFGVTPDRWPLRRAASRRTRGRQFVGRSPRILEVLECIPAVAAIDANVLITGETGTGKEITAELIHQSSARGDGRLIAINSAAIPDSLLESELFGYERGAFTGAASAQEGQLELADGGTLFLDEIGDMSRYAQAKILRAIEIKEIHRLGGRRAIPVDIRVMAATNQDLERSIDAGSFRKDLYYRLNVARIHLPPLRERREDIPLLLDHYVSELNERYGRHIEGLTNDLRDYLVEYNWPGNIRELKNLVEALFLSVRRSSIGWEDLPGPFRRRLGLPSGTIACEREQLVSALSATKWNKSRAAQRLNWSRMTIYRKIAKYDIVRSPSAADSRNIEAPED